MKESLSPEIQAQQDELQRLLEEYYQMKVDGLESTAEYKELENQIEIIKQDVLTRYKSEIDSAFDGL